MIRPLVSSALILAVLAPSRLPAQLDQLDRAPSRFTTLDGARVHFKSLGAGRTALVLVHGWASDLTVWRYQAGTLAGRIRVVALDLPGHGRSGRPAVPPTLALYARAVRQVMDAAQVDRAVLVGHSMGAPVVRDLLRQAPDRTVGLVSVDGALVRPALDSAAVERMLAPYTGEGYRQALQDMASAMYPGEPQSVLRRSVATMGLATSRETLEQSLRAMLDPAAWRQDRIAVPLLVIVAKGPTWPPSYRVAVERLATDLVYEEVDGVGHFLQLERPEVVNAALTRFLLTLQVMR